MNSLTIKNLKGRPAATAVLLVLSSLLCFAVFVGSIMVNSLSTGLSSLEKRLGADVMAVPYEAATKKKFENMIRQCSIG